jgi:hypothetical protein
LAVQRGGGGAGSTSLSLACLLVGMLRMGMLRMLGKMLGSQRAWLRTPKHADMTSCGLLGGSKYMTGSKYMSLGIQKADACIFTRFTRKMLGTPKGRRGGASHGHTEYAWQNARLGAV